MNNNPYVSISKRDIITTINVLKSLEVRGYDSMYKLVGAVEFLEGKLSEQSKPSDGKDVDHEFGPRIVENQDQN